MEKYMRKEEDIIVGKGFGVMVGTAVGGKPASK